MVSKGIKYPKYLEAGMRFGKLEVLDVDEMSKYKEGKKIKPSCWQYICKCDCGNIHTARKNSLVQGVTTSCGYCKFPKYLSPNETYGNFKVIRVDEDSKFKDGKPVIPSQWKYVVECVCGNITKVSKSNICSGAVKSCGCSPREKNRERLGKINKMEIVGEIIKVFFNNTNNYMIVDKNDLYNVNPHCWSENNEGYAYTNIYYGVRERKQVFLHRHFLNVPDDLKVDHKNGLHLDNRRSNIRISTPLENSRNRIVVSSKNPYSGVVERADGSFDVSITVEGERLYLGHFGDVEEAIDAKQIADLKYFGEFAYHISRPDPNITLDQIVEEYRLEYERLIRHSNKKEKQNENN